MSDKLFPPRIPEGRELEYWIINVSRKIGVNPPATLEELGQESVVPLLSKVHDLERQISSVRGELRRSNSQVSELKRKINDLERSI